MKYLLGVIAVIAAFVFESQFITIFVIQPIGAVPEGRTLVITRLTNMNFIDSADAICGRKMGGVSLLCRAAVMGRVGEQSSTLLRLPYSEMLYTFTRGGR